MGNEYLEMTISRIHQYYPSAVIQGHDLVFPEATAAGFVHEMMSIPRFDSLQDPGGTASLIPYMDMFYDNSLQTVCNFGSPTNSSTNDSEVST